MAITVGSTATLLTGSTDLGAGGVTNNTASAAGTAHDNRTNLNMYGDFELNVTFGSNATVNTTVDLYLIPSVDNSNFADTVAITSATAPRSVYYVGSFPLLAATAQRVELTRIPLPPDQFKAQIYNTAGVTLPNTATVKMTPYKIG